ncbi:28396_t:CDS:2, partial [Dentiscutata erythropus]
ETLQSDFAKDLIDLSFDNDLIEVFALAIEDTLELILANSNVVQIVRDTLQYCSTTDVRPYDNVQFTQKGIFCDGIMCSWYLIEHIVSSDECIICYLDLKLWATVRSYPVEEVAKSYWSTLDEDDEFDEEFNSHLYGSDNVSLVDDTPLETWNEWIEPGTYLLSDYDPDEDVKLVFPKIEPDNTGNKNNIELATIPWWLPNLEILSLFYLLEFNNFYSHYLCNSVWWMITNPTTYII